MKKQTEINVVALDLGAILKALVAKKDKDLTALSQALVGTAEGVSMGQAMLADWAANDRDILNRILPMYCEVVSQFDEKDETGKPIGKKLIMQLRSRLNNATKRVLKWKTALTIKAPTKTCKVWKVQRAVASGKVERVTTFDAPMKDVVKGLKSIKDKGTRAATLLSLLDKAGLSISDLIAVDDDYSEE